MASFNQVILLGNLTRDPQLRYTPSQMSLCEFAIATNYKYKTKDGQEREEVTFVDCTAWGKQAELINQYCTKGRPLFIQGRLKLDTWEDKNGGGKRSKLSVVVENFQFVGGRDGGGGGGGGGGSYEGGGQPQARSSSRGPAPAQRAPQNVPDDGPSPISDEPQVQQDDIPF